MAASEPSVADLLGEWRILIADDDDVVARGVEAELAMAGATVLGPLPDVNQALALLESGTRIDAAVLDLRLREQFAWPLVKALRRRGVPVLLHTDCDTELIPAGFRDLPCHPKPQDAPIIARRLAEMLSERSTPV